MKQQLHLDYIGLCSDEIGFLDRMGLDADPQTCFLENLFITINTINLLHKTNASFSLAQDMATLMVIQVPWRNRFPLDDHIAELSCILPKFTVKDMAKNPFPDLSLLAPLYDVPQGDANAHVYYAYLQYATEELERHWARPTALMVAPLYRWGSYQPEFFGSLAPHLVSTAYIPTVDFPPFFCSETNSVEYGVLEADGSYTSIEGLTDNDDLPTVITSPSSSCVDSDEEEQDARNTEETGGTIRLWFRYEDGDFDDYV